MEDFADDPGLRTWRHILFVFEMSVHWVRTEEGKCHGSTL
jgi:hypothetical protein